MPSSLGLSVLVPATVGQVAVQVAWGHYERETLLGEELEALLEARRAANVATGNGRRARGRSCATRRGRR